MIMKGEERRAFTTAKLSLVHNLTVDCLTFAHFLLPSHTFNDFLGHHHHWMEWLGATIDINGFSMVLRSGNHWFQWFTMVFHHWSNDGMVAHHRWSLSGQDEIVLKGVWRSSRIWIFSRSHVIMRITFLIEKSISRENEICCFLSCQEKSNSRVDENYWQRELLLFCLG